MSVLYQMMGCFNQDWYLDHASLKAAVDAYLTGTSTESIQQALAELRELLA